MGSFVDYISLMYDEVHSPTRTIQANGYLSSPFPIRSGVAQGCPLPQSRPCFSFLLVAQALKYAVDMRDGVQGIQVGDYFYKLRFL